MITPYAAEPRHHIRLRKTSITHTAKALVPALTLAVAILITSACVPDDEIVLTPAQKKTIAEHILKEEPTPQHKVGANLEDRIELIGYDLTPASPEPGKDFTITWYWRCLAEMDLDWMIFVHLDSYMGGRYRKNLDHHAVMGLYNTRNWKKGEIIKDVQKARFSSTFPEGEVTIWVGAFHGDTRLRVRPGVPTDGHNRVKAGVMKVQRKTPASDLPQLRVKKTTTPIRIDGKLDEPAWATAASTGKWRTTDGRGTPSKSTKARMIWNDDYLFIGVECEDDDVWTEFKNRDSNLWEQEVIEIFIDPENDGKTYAELQVSPANVVFDAYFPTYRSDLSMARRFDSGIKSAVVVDGTINKRDDKDQGWTLELAVPFAKLPPGKRPSTGDRWRLNLFRFDAPQGKRQEASAWSPPKVGDFHALHRFGYIIFTGS